MSDFDKNFFTWGDRAILQQVEDFLTGTILQWGVLTCYRRVYYVCPSCLLVGHDIKFLNTGFRHRFFLWVHIPHLYINLYLSFSGLCFFCTLSLNNLVGPLYFAWTSRIEVTLLICLSQMRFSKVLNQHSRKEELKAEGSEW